MKVTTARHIVLLFLYLINNPIACGQSFDGVYSFDSFDDHFILPQTEFNIKSRIKAIEQTSFFYYVENGDTIVDPYSKKVDLSFKIRYEFNKEGLPTYVIAQQTQKDLITYDTTTIFRYDSLLRIIEIENHGDYNEQYEWFIYAKSRDIGWEKAHHTVRFSSTSSRHYHRSVYSFRNTEDPCDSIVVFSCIKDTAWCKYHLTDSIAESHSIRPLKKEKPTNPPKNAKIVTRKKRKKIFYFNDKNQLVEQIEKLKKTDLVVDYFYNADGTINYLTCSSFDDGIEHITKDLYFYKFF